LPSSARDTINDNANARIKVVVFMFL